MFITDIKRNTGTTIGHVGLAFIAEMARISGLDRLVDRLSPAQMPQIKEHEIFRTLAGLISQGKTDFDHVREYSDNDFFATSLGLGYGSMAELRVGLEEYFAFYNTERPYQSLGQRTPEAVYRTAEGGGALIVDKFPRVVEAMTEQTVKTGQHRPAAKNAECAA